MLKQILKKNKITQSTVAAKLGVSQQLVSFWCTGRIEPPIRQLRPLSQIIGVDIDTIIDCFTKPEEVEA